MMIISSPFNSCIAAKSEFLVSFPPALTPLEILRERWRHSSGVKRWESGSRLAIVWMAPNALSMSASSTSSIPLSSFPGRRGGSDTWLKRDSKSPGEDVVMMAQQLRDMRVCEIEETCKMILKVNCGGYLKIENTRVDSEEWTRRKVVQD